MSNPSPEPSTADTGRVTIAGDYTDNDAAVIDSLVESHAQPPEPVTQPTMPLVVAVPPKPMTRLMVGSIAVQAGWAPVLLMPADPNRINLQLWAASDTSTDYARVSDDAGKVQSKGGSALLYSGQLLKFQVGTHTGPVWVYAPDGTGPVTVSFIAVTT
jgi:hypothetical protein